MDKDALEVAFQQAGLTCLLPYSTTLLQPALRLCPTLTADEQIAIGASKLGGLPDLPVDLQWPSLRGIPQSFIAQIHLNELQPFAFTHQLPVPGTLWFFYDAERQTYGENSGDAVGWRVLYHPTTRLARAHSPSRLPDKALFRSATLTFRPELTLAQYPQRELPHLPWNEQQQQAYTAIFEQFYHDTDKQAPRHQLLGYPYTLHNDMRSQCQRVTRNGTDWHLLLQVASDAALHMHWGDPGMLYFWIKETDLQMQRFNRAWMIIQAE